MNKKFYIVLLILIIMSAFSCGYFLGRDSTVVTFQGMPDDAVIHFEINKGGAD